MNLGERYAELRKSKLDQDNKPLGVNAFSKKIGIAPPRISELEHNKREMSLTELKAYHSFFNVSFEYLLGETDNKTTDVELLAICKTTGLNENAIYEIITHTKKNLGLGERHQAILNQLIMSEEFWEIIIQYSSIQVLNEKINEIKTDYNISNRLEMLKYSGDYRETSRDIDICRYSVIRNIEKISNMFDGREQQ